MNIDDLLKLNVNDHTEQKNGLTYLSWAWAWAKALTADPTATFEVQMFGHEVVTPVCYIGDTGMVFVSVTMFGKKMTCQLPVMDYRNKAIKSPDAFAVNTAIQRCLVKALALHGLGLYIYAGEDLPGEGVDKVTGEIHSFQDDVKGDVFKNIQPDIQNALRVAAQHVAKAKSSAEAMDIIAMTIEEWPDEDPSQLKIGMWSLLDSKTRSALKKHSLEQA